MKHRLRVLWTQVYESLWFIPSLMTLGAAIASYLLLELDRSIEDQEVVREIAFVFDVGSEGARQTLSAIAQSIITVTGVIFSVTIIALQLTASQFTPRVLRTYMKDRGTQWVLGIFIGTYTFTLLVERTVGSPPGGDDPFIPAISVTVAIGLALLSVGALIYFINHIAQSIRAANIIDNVTADARALIDRLFPEDVGDDADDRADAVGPGVPQSPPLVIPSRKGGYLNSLDEDTLFAVATEGSALIRMEPHMGHFLLPGEPLASIWFGPGAGDAASREKIARKVEAAFTLGGEWTLHQDLERALVELSDIAVRALSPSLNDPTTAVMCVDRLAEILVLLGRRRYPSRFRSDGNDRVGFIAQRLSFERAVGVAFEKIRHYAARSPSVAIRLIQVSGRIMEQIPPHRHEPLRAEIRNMLELGRKSLESSADLERLEEAADEALG